MTNRDAAEHFGKLKPEDEATVLLYHPDSACLPVGNLCELDAEDLDGFPDGTAEAYAGEVAVNAG